MVPVAALNPWIAVPDPGSRVQLLIPLPIAIPPRGSGKYPDRQMQKQKDEIRQQVLFLKIRYWICPKNEMIVAYKNIEKKENKCLHEKFEKQEKIRILIKLIKEKEDTEKQYGKEIEEQK